MNFAFSSYSAGENPEEPVEPVRQPWMGPSEDVLGATVPIGLVLARSESVVIALTHVTTYPDGCSLVLRVAGRRAGMREDDWWELADAAFGHGHPRRRRGDGLPDSRRRYAVRFGDGRTATTLASFPHWMPDEEPTPPVLYGHGSSGGSSGDGGFQIDEQLWLWPLPPAEPFELITEWPLAGIPVTIAELDGAAITAAAAQAIPYWPDV